MVIVPDRAVDELGELYLTFSSTFIGIEFFAFNSGSAVGDPTSIRKKSLIDLMLHDTLAWKFEKGKVYN